ncbi:MAG: mandelate racemase/muconate lactonizing enzyme family protein [Clostridiales Family XIII bacterium]|nr:mandelate racemase/muconate lactonizing enzyme family protein [Clostridiales Family XIII bacterium]
MKITKVDVILVQDADEEARGRRPVFCRIYTDEGIFGDGEAGVIYGVASPAAFEMVKDLAIRIIGSNPLNNEDLWERMYRTTFWCQNGGPITFAGMSAIDMALWDIKGKFFNAPVHMLLGGRMRDSLRAYASQLQFGWGESRKPALTAADYADSAMAALRDGYDAIKYDFLELNEYGQPFARDERMGLLRPQMIDLIERRVSAIREAIGKDVEIIVENHGIIDSQGAVQIGRALEKYNIFYFEEPSTPDPTLTKYISERIRIPLAGGERIYTRWQYSKYFEDHSLQVIQPDIGNCGGITEVKKICDMAYTYDVSVQPHVCASPLSTAAALQVEAAIPNFLIHEQHFSNLFAANKALCIYDYQPTNGKFAIPDLPGIGNSLSDYAMNSFKKHTVS